jgi:predicted esterase
LHGLGDTGHGWSQSISNVRPKSWKLIAPTAYVLPHLNVSLSVSLFTKLIHFLFNANFRSSKPVTLNGGFSMPSWFDILGLSESCQEDVEGIHKASIEIKQMIDDEISSTGISSENIILGGFSQGGALALYTALTSEKKLGGVVALSTWLPIRQEFPEKLTEVNKSIKIFQAHGHIDPVVALRWGEATKIFLGTLGVTNYTFKKYPDMMHGSCEEEMSDVRNFLATL